MPIIDLIEQKPVYILWTVPLLILLYNSITIASGDQIVRWSAAGSAGKCSTVVR